MTQQQDKKYIKEVSDSIIYQITNCIYGDTCNFGALEGKIGVLRQDIIEASEYLVSQNKATIETNDNSYFSRITLK